MNQNTIPNPMIVILALAFYVFAVVTGMSLEAIWGRSLLAVAMFIAGFAVFCAGILGAGGIKLITVAFLWLGFPAGCAFVVVSMMMAVIHARLSGRQSIVYLPFASITAVGFVALSLTNY